MIEYYKNLSLENIFYIDEKGIVQEEEWRDVVGFESLYKVSDLGRVKSLRNNFLKKEKILKGGISRYRTVGLRKNGKTYCFCIHVLVAMSFLGHVPGGHKKVVDHKNNNNYLDNSVSNLQVITHRENDSKDSVNKTGSTGIVKTTLGKYSVYANLGKTTYLGVFDKLEEAINIRALAVSLYDSGQDFSHLKQKKKVEIRKGVYKKVNTFYARVNVKGKTINLGYFKTKEEGYEARILALIKYGIIEA